MKMRNSVSYTAQCHDRIIRHIDTTDSVAIDRLKTAVLKSILIFYEHHTARETCEAFGIPFTGEFVKILHRLSPKGLGMGGARKGSGQKKNNQLHH